MSSEPQVPAQSPPTSEEIAVNQWSSVIGQVAQLNGMIQAWVNSAIHCLELGDPAGFQKHIIMADGAAANLVSLLSRQIKWPEMLERMRAAGAKPPVTTMLALLSRERGLVHGATWWGTIDASTALGAGMPGPDAQAYQCVVIPLQPADTQKSEAPKLVLAR